MGQMTYALIYGVEEDDAGRWIGEDGDGGIINAWERECKPRIDALATKSQRSPWDVNRLYIPDHSYGSNDPCVYGFWIAVGASGERGIPDLESVALSPAAVRANYTTSYAKAKRRWRRFAKWCAASGYSIPKACIWLVQTEVA